MSQTWAEPSTCRSAAELQRRVDESDRIQREEYPAIGGRARVEAYPELRAPGRRYDRDWEAKHWDLGPVLHWLSGHTVSRQVDKNGKVSLYDRCHWVGRRHIGRSVWVTLDPEEVAWVIADAKGSVLKRVQASELTAQGIGKLSVSRPRRGNGQT